MGRGYSVSYSCFARVVASFLGKMKLDVRYGNKQKKVELTVGKGQGLLASWTRLDELHTACLEENLPR